MGITLPLLAWSIPARKNKKRKNGKISTLASTLGFMWDAGVAGLPGHWLPTRRPLLPQGIQSNWKNRTSAWRSPRRSPRATREGAARPPDPRTGVEVMQGPRQGVTLAQDRTAGAGERLQADAKSWSTTPPQDLRLPAGQWGAPCRPSPDPAEGAGRKGQVRDPGAPGSQCARRRNGAAAPSAPDGSPAAKYRLSTPVLASRAPSASVAKFLCSRRRSKRWRRPSMAPAGPGLAARARRLPRAPATQPVCRLPQARAARLRPRAGLHPRAGLRPLPPAPANGRAGRTKEVGPAPSPPPHCPLAGRGRRSRDSEGRGRGAEAVGADWRSGGRT